MPIEYFHASISGLTEASLLSQRHASSTFGVTLIFSAFRHFMQAPWQASGLMLITELHTCRRCYLASHSERLIFAYQEMIMILASLQQIEDKPLLLCAGILIAVDNAATYASCIMSFTTDWPEPYCFDFAITRDYYELNQPPLLEIPRMTKYIIMAIRWLAWYFSIYLLWQFREWPIWGAQTFRFFWA